jgi:hypothetical protein
MSLLTWSEHAPLKNDHFFLSFFFEAVLGFVSLAGKVTIIFEWFTIQFMHLTLAMAPRPLATRQETWPGQTGRDTTADIRWIQVGRALGIAICAPRRYVELVDEGRGAKFMAFFFSFERGERERRTGTGRRLLVNMQTVEGYPRVVGKRVSKSKFIFFSSVITGAPPSLSFSLVFYFSDSFPTILAHAWFTTVIIR